MTDLTQDITKYGSHLNAIVHYCQTLPKDKKGFTSLEAIKIEALANDLVMQVNNLAYPLFKADAMDRLEQIASLTV